MMSFEDITRTDVFGTVPLTVWCLRILEDRFYNTSSPNGKYHTIRPCCITVRNRKDCMEKKRMFMQTYKGISSISGLQKKIVFPAQHPYSWNDAATVPKVIFRVWGTCGHSKAVKKENLSIRTTETRFYEPARLSTPPKPLFSLKQLNAVKWAFSIFSIHFP